MKCPMATQESAALLVSYSARLLDAEKAALVEKHLDGCPACREFVDGQSAVWEALDVWEPEPIAADFDRRLYQRIEQQVSWWDKLVRPFRPLLVRQGLPLAAAAAVIMAGVYLDREAAAPPAPIRQSAQVETVQPDQMEHALDELDMLNQFNHLMRSDTADSQPRM
jgi:anti-sigma factor RsiW